jgi:hypothetical protein
MVRRGPLGVVLCLGPYYPLNETLLYLFFNNGNTVVLNQQNMVYYYYHP